MISLVISQILESSNIQILNFNVRNSGGQLPSGGLR